MRQLDPIHRGWVQNAASRKLAKAGWRIRDAAILGVAGLLAWVNLAATTAFAGAWAWQDDDAAAPDELPPNFELRDERESDSTQPAIDLVMQRQVRLLQRQLNADQVAERDRAQQALLELGPQVLDYLNVESAAYSAELNGRIRRVRLGLETLVSQRITQPLLVNFAGTISGEQAVELIAKQTENRLSISPELAAKQVTIDWQDKNFWEAVDQLSDQMEASVSPGRPGELMLSSRVFPVSRSELSSYSGGFRASASTIQSFRNLQAGTGNVTNLTMTLDWEPRLRLIRMEMPLGELVIKDAAGKRLYPPEPEDSKKRDDDHEDPQQPANRVAGVLEFGIGRTQSHADIPFSLPLPDDIAGDEIQVSGKINALVAGRQEVFLFPELSKAFQEQSSIERSGITVQVMGKQDDQHLMAVRLAIRFSDAKKSLESHLGWVYENPATLIDAQGERHPYLTIESGGQKEDSMELIYLFDQIDDLENCTLEYQSPGILLETEVLFDLKKIKLP